jgi:hypothetical protein
MAQYFYDSQIRRFLIQFARIFSNWQVTKGKDQAGNDILIRVPIMYGDMSRMVAAQIAENSTSSLPSAPLITYHISGLEYDQRRTQDPYYIEQLSVRQRTFNQETGNYENTQGQAFTVERIMPVPYTLRITVDFWTTNYQQKLELIEQLGVLFNPSMEIQSTDNFIDWTSLSVVYQDGLTFSSRSIPQGTGNPIDVMTWKFYMPIWISSAAKVTKLNIIYKIIASIFKGNALSDMQDDDLLLGTRQKITPYGYKILFLGNTLQLVPENQPFDPSNSTLDTPVGPNTGTAIMTWQSMLNSYGVIRPGISQIWLENPYMDTEIVGTIAFHPTDDRLLIYNIDPDTLPQNTLAPVNSVINPLQKGPSDLLEDNGLPLPVQGQRYLIVEDIGSGINQEPSNAWGNLIAKANSIVEYDGTQWFVSFDASILQDINFVTNLTTGIQYRYDGSTWMKSYEGWYPAGDFSVVI